MLPYLRRLIDWTETPGRLRVARCEFGVEVHVASFLLDTTVDQDFCSRCCGEFMHHEPDVATTGPQTPKQFAADVNRLLSYTYNQLGEDTSCRWCARPVADAMAVA